MLRVTRNALTLLVVGVMLFSSTHVNAKSKYYKVNIDGTHTTWYPGQTSSSYNIWIDEPFAVPDFPSIHQHNPCRYGCVESSKFLTRCSGSGVHIARILPDISEIRREQQQQLLHNAQVELLEAQAALTRQLARNARRPAEPHPNSLAGLEKQRRAAQKRLGSHDALVNALIKSVQLGGMTPEEAIGYYLERTRDDQPLFDSSGSALSYIKGADKRVRFIRSKLEEAGLLPRAIPAKKQRVHGSRRLHYVPPPPGSLSFGERMRRLEAQQAARRSPQLQPTPKPKKKYKNEFDVMVEIVRRGILDPQTALSRFAKIRDARTVSQLREALVRAKLLEAPRTLGNGKFLSLP